MDDSQPEVVWGAAKSFVNQVYAQLDESYQQAHTGASGSSSKPAAVGVTKNTTKYSDVYSAIHNFLLYESDTGGGVSAGQLYLYKSINDYIKERLETVFDRVRHLTGPPMLRAYTTEYKKFEQAIVRLLNNIFNSMNNTFVETSRRHHEVRSKFSAHDSDDENDNGDDEPKYPIKMLALKRWKEIVYQRLGVMLTSNINEYINRQRDGEQIESKLVKDSVGMFVKHGIDYNDIASIKEPKLFVYDEDFEPRFLQATHEYYSKECTGFLAQHSIGEYMVKADARLTQEVQRVRHFLVPTTETKLQLILRDTLIGDHAQRMRDEFPTILGQSRWEDAGRMYRLLSLVQGGNDPLFGQFRDFLEEQGLDRVATNADQAFESPEEFVRTMLTVYRDFNNIVSEAFGRDAGFVASMDKAMRRIVNENEVCKKAKSAEKTPELLARYVNNLLVKKCKVDEEEVERLLDDVLVVFKYAEAKDVFSQYYSHLLARRLISQMSRADHLESSMIGKLKATCGPSYTNKLQTMFTDMETSKELDRAFQEYAVSKKLSIPFAFSCRVLTSVAWPFKPNEVKFTIPKELENGVAQFTMFYKSKHNGRLLQWLYDLSKGEVTGKLGGRTYIFSTSTYQMTLMLALNSTKKKAYTVNDLLASTGMPRETLVDTLELLTTFKVFQSTWKKGTEMDGKTAFRVNPKFKSKVMKININQKLKRHTQKESKQVNDSVQTERKHQIQACIVRIMKTKKHMVHRDLVSEALKQLSKWFQPRVPDIKKQIDNLIEREYLERAADQKDRYNYLA